MASAATKMFLRRAAAKAPSPLAFARRDFAAVTARTKSAAPETPLMHYTATQAATSSINHRILWVNITFLILVADAGSAVIDL
eukprot:CAMPEP_0183432322 /NCGR_PEP_ID=MMETSP0370-20130417/56942_1 /TAXON_ID=268820 /ORGANISM="Peridinium aciculiferum, Strain PAER-2" /LENGTH=82 /DNA_ID=CAMNT_0025618255 /DNA_START=91 /DNA_END=339 /DNA_ORIENTATION=+